MKKSKRHNAEIVLAPDTSFFVMRENCRSYLVERLTDENENINYYKTDVRKLDQTNDLERYYACVN